MVKLRICFLKYIHSKFTSNFTFIIFAYFLNKL